MTNIYETKFYAEFVCHHSVEINFNSGSKGISSATSTTAEFFNYILLAGMLQDSADKIP